MWRVRLGPWCKTNTYIRNVCIDIMPVYVWAENPKEEILSCSVLKSAAGVRRHTNTQFTITIQNTFQQLIPDSNNSSVLPWRAAINTRSHQPFLTPKLPDTWRLPVSSLSLSSWLYITSLTAASSRKSQLIPHPPVGVCLSRLLRIHRCLTPSSPFIHFYPLTLSLSPCLVAAFSPPPSLAAARCLDSYF